MSLAETATVTLKPSRRTARPALNRLERAERFWGWVMILPLCMWMVNRPRPYLAAFVLALVLQGRFGGSSFLPASDAGVIAVEVRTPSSSSLEYARLKLEAAAALARLGEAADA